MKHPQPPQEQKDRDELMAGIARSLASVDQHVRENGHPGPPGSGLHYVLGSLIAQHGIVRFDFPEPEEETAAREAAEKEAADKSQDPAGKPGPGKAAGSGKGR